MKKITIQLNTKSINDARKYLLNLKKQIPKMEQELLMGIANWIVKQANGYIDRADLGSAVKSELKSHWHFEKTTNGIKIINDTNVERKVRGQTETVPLAVLVEFGVGIVGKSQPHPNASEEGYEYNVSSSSKASDGSWHFYSDEADLDIPKSAINWGLWGQGTRNRMSIYTKGTQGVWYAYNAIVDVKNELSKSGGGEIGKMWEDIKARYIK